MGNSLGNFINIADETRIKKDMAYARICVYMHIAKMLHNSISILHDEFEWIQTIYYEHVTFFGRLFHNHGHIFIYFPLNQSSKDPKSSDSKDVEGFTKVTGRRPQSKKTNGAPAQQLPNTNNNFDALSSLTSNAPSSSTLMEPPSKKPNVILQK